MGWDIHLEVILGVIHSVLTRGGVRSSPTKKKFKERKKKESDFGVIGVMDGQVWSTQGLAIHSIMVLEDIRIRFTRL